MTLCFVAALAVMLDIWRRYVAWRRRVLAVEQDGQAGAIVPPKLAKASPGQGLFSSLHWRWRGAPASSAPVVTVLPQLAVRPEVQPTPLVVRHLNDGKATLLVRYRVRQKAWTAHLIIWAGRKRVSFEDSYYDLGLLNAQASGQGVPPGLIVQALELARTKLAELAQAGQGRKRLKSVKAAPVPMPELAVEVEPKPESRVAVAPEPPVATVSPIAVASTGPDEVRVKVKRFPSVVRGIVLEWGVMPREKEGRHFTNFGLRLRVAEAGEETLWGQNLEVALVEAGACIGDEVEVIKAGRKQIEPGKAPMNLYTITVLRRGQAAA